MQICVAHHNHSIHMQMGHGYISQFYQFVCYHQPLLILLGHFAVIISMYNCIDCHCELRIA